MNHQVRNFFVSGMVISAALLSGCAENSNFNFEDATIEERQEWMDKQAAKLRTSARFALPSGGGPMALSMKLDSVDTRPRTRELQMNIAVKVPYGATVSTIPYSDGIVLACRNYVKTRLYDQEVRLITVFKTKKEERQLLKLTASPRKCDKALDDAEL